MSTATDASLTDSSIGPSTASRSRVRLLVLLALIVAVGIFGWLRVPAYYANEVAEALFLRDVQTATKAIAAGTKWAPSDPELLFLSARTSRMLGRFPEMDTALEKAIASGLPAERATNERLLAAAQSGQIDAARERLLAKLATGDDVSATCEAYVLGCLMKYQLREAEGVLETWKKDLPADPQPYFLAGRLAEHNVNMPKAIEQFEQALQLSPQHAPAAYNLARVLVGQQQYDRAEAAYQQAAMAVWQPLPAQLGIVQCRMEKGDFDSAAAILDGLESADTDSMLEVFRYLGDPSYLALSRLPSLKGRLFVSQEKYAEALSEFELALQSNPHDWRTRYQYALALKKAGQDEEAKQELASVDASRSALEKCDEYITRVRANPADVEARYLIGKTMLEHVSEYQGIVWLTSVLEYDADHADALALLGQHADTASQFFQKTQDNRRGENNHRAESP